MVLSGQAWDTALGSTTRSPTMIRTMSNCPNDGYSSVCQAWPDEKIRSSFTTLLVNLAPWRLYLTLTYDARRPGYDGRYPSTWASQAHLRRYHLRSSDILRRPTFLVGALEQTYLGAPHWHALLAAGDVSSWEFQALSREWYVRHGYARFDRIKAGTGATVAEYVAKYLTKESAELMFLGPFRDHSAAVQDTLASPGGRNPF